MISLSSFSRPILLDHVQHEQASNNESGRTCSQVEGISDSVACAGISVDVRPCLRGEHKVIRHSRTTDASMALLTPTIDPILPTPVTAATVTARTVSGDALAVAQLSVILPETKASKSKLCVLG